MGVGRRHSRHHSLARMVFVAAAALAFGGITPAFGHAILISRGTLVAHRDRLVVEIEVSAEDFFHYYHLRVDDGRVTTSDVRGAVDRHGAYLLEHFSIRDGVGERLSGRVTGVRAALPSTDQMPFLSLRESRATYVLEYTLPRATGFLTLQQRFGDESATLPSQLVLSVKSVDAPYGRIVQLTSGGNFETVELEEAPHVAPVTSFGDGKAPTNRPPEAAMGADRYKEIYGFVRHNTAGECVVDVYLPLVLLETFMPVPRSRPDFLDRAEMDAAIEAVRSRFVAHPPAIFSAGERAADGRLRIDRIQFLGPEAISVDDEAEPARQIGAWSARVALRMRWTGSSPDSLEWRMFNSSVLNATLWRVIDGAACCEETLMPGDAEMSLATP